MYVPYKVITTMSCSHLSPCVVTTILMTMLSKPYDNPMSYRIMGSSPFSTPFPFSTQAPTSSPLATDSLLLLYHPHS